MQSYIVRIYRKEKDDPREFVGMVEEVGEKGEKAFTTFEELWSILKSANKDAPREERNR